MRHDVDRFNRWAPTYEKHRLQHIIFEPVQQAVLDLAAEQVARPHTILDVGCGTGRLLRTAESRFPGARLLGVDAATEMVKQARASLPSGSAIEFQQATAEELPFPAGHFDLVFSTMTYHHWADQPRAVAEIARVLGANGRWIVADFIASGLIGYIRRLLRMRHSLDPKVFDAMIARAGLRIVAERRPRGFAAGRIPVLAIGRS